MGMLWRGLPCGGTGLAAVRNLPKIVGFVLVQGCWLVVILLPLRIFWASDEDKDGVSQLCSLAGGRSEVVATLREPPVPPRGVVRCGDNCPPESVCLEI